MDTWLAVASKRDWRSYADRPVPEDVQQRILDAGRLSGSSVNKQPWLFVVVESDDAKERIAEVVYAGENIRTCAFAVAIATDGGKYPFDVGCPRARPRRRPAPGEHPELRLPEAPAGSGVAERRRVERGGEPQAARRARSPGLTPALPWSR